MKKCLQLTCMLLLIWGVCPSTAIGQHYINMKGLTQFSADYQAIDAILLKKAETMSDLENTPLKHWRNGSPTLPNEKHLPSTHWGVGSEGVLRELIVKLDYSNGYQAIIAPIEVKSTSALVVVQLSKAGALSKIVFAQLATDESALSMSVDFMTPTGTSLLSGRSGHGFPLRMQKTSCAVKEIRKSRLRVDNYNWAKLVHRMVGVLATCLTD